MFDVLVIDDDALVRDSIAAVLELEGLSVHATEKPDEGLRVLEEGGTRLVVLDLVLADTPFGTEPSSSREVADAAARSGVPVLVVSGLPDLPRRAAALGAGSWLSKPFSYKQLMTSVSAARR